MEENQNEKSGDVARILGKYRNPQRLANGAPLAELNSDGLCAETKGLAATATPLAPPTEAPQPQPAAVAETVGGANYGEDEAPAVALPQDPKAAVIDGLKKLHGLTERQTGLYVEVGDGDARFLVQPIAVEGYVRTQAGSIAGYLVKTAAGGAERQRLVPPKAVRSPSQLATELEHLGVIAPTTTRELQLIGTYIHAVGSLQELIGLWTEGVHFIDYAGKRVPVAVMGSTIIGATNIPVVSCFRGRSAFSQAGTRDTWMAEVHPLLAQNRWLRICLAFSVSGALATLFGLPRPSLLLWGPSSTGKSTAASLILSAHTNPSQLRQWTATSNGLESWAAMHLDLPLVLDELGSRGRASILDTIYRLSGSATKLRANSRGETLESEDLRTSFFATSEITLRAQAKASKETVQRGHDVRMPQVEVFGKYGIFDRIDTYSSPAEFATAFTAAIRRNYGTVYPTVVTKMVEGHANLAKRIEQWRERLNHATGSTSGPLSEVEGRVKDQFVTLGLAEHVLQHCGFLQEARPVTDTATLFTRWCDGYRSRTASKNTHLIREVRTFLKTRSGGLFVPLADWADSSKSMLAGYTKPDADGSAKTFLIHPEYFEDEICKEHDPTLVLRALKAEGYLTLAPSEKGFKYLVQMPRRAGPKRRMSFIAVSDSILLDATAADCFDVGSEDQKAE